MTPEEIVAKAAAEVARHEADTTYLRAVGAALEQEASTRRTAEAAPMTPAEAAAVVAAVAVPA